MSRIKLSSGARQVLAPITEAHKDAAPAVKEGMETMLKTAAALDGDRVVDKAEADAIALAIGQMTTGGVLETTGDVHNAQSALDVRLGTLKAARPKSTDVVFTTQGRGLTRFRSAILGSMESTLQRAQGRPVDINVMIFSFTDKVIANGILGLAEKHPNLNVRILTDWAQLPTSGSRQPTRILREAKKRGLTNIEVKYKQDAPYVWKNGRPGYDHGKSQGLNHHKGFVSLIDGRPDKMATGSFNWSISAMRSNRENLMTLDSKNTANADAMAGYQSEFQAFWNDDVAMTYNEAAAYKDSLYQKLHEERGLPYTPRDIDTSFEDLPYHPVDTSLDVDVNSMSDEANAALVELLGKRTTAKLERELRDYGRFDTMDELLERVPDLAGLDEDTLGELGERARFGDGGVSINTASVSELDRAGLSRRQAERVVDLRESHGAFESVAELDDVRGIGKGTLGRVAPSLTAASVAGFYSARRVGESAMTGFSKDHHGTLDVPAAGSTTVDGPEDGRVIDDVRGDMTAMNRDLSAPVTDLFRRAEPGQTIRVAMYGFSTRSPEFAELKKAANRGVSVRAVVYGRYSGGAKSAMEAMKHSGLDVDVRSISRKVMHEKFATVGDDVVNGSANFSTSSIGKHSEDRFVFRNQPDVATAFNDEFARLWKEAERELP